MASEDEQTWHLMYIDRMKTSTSERGPHHVAAPKIDLNPNVPNVLTSYGPPRMGGVFNLVRPG